MKDITVKFDLGLDSLNITTNSIAAYMGYSPGKIPQPVQTALDDFFNSLPTNTSLRCAYKIFESVTISEEGFYCEGINFQTGDIIASQLKGSQAAAFFAVTAGSVFDSWSSQEMQNGNMLLGYTIDCAGSQIAENLAIHVQKHIEEKASGFSMVITNRFSPGYCSWDIVEQKKLFSLLPLDFCGITLSESSLMIPMKSVSGVIGIGKNVKKLEYQCKICRQENCLRRSVNL